MNNNQQIEELKQEYLNMNVPQEGLERMKQSIDRAKLEKRRIRLRSRIRTAGIGMAAALAVAVALPNVNADIAYAMGNIPVLGSFFKVVTLRDFQYDDVNNSAQVRAPQVTLDKTGENAENQEKLQDAVQKINVDIEKITQELIDQFQKTVSEQKGEGHNGLFVDHEVILDSDRWFTLRLVVVETKASSYEYYKYYTVDKLTGEVVTLGDLFRDGSDYVSVISEEIKRQMRADMAADENKIYFLDSDEPIEEFQQITGVENFYFNAAGELVIIFNEYDVAPGYMGTPEFTIGQDIISGILK